jgi:maltodextrin utilization protein YvdJ
LIIFYLNLIKKLEDHRLGVGYLKFGMVEAVKVLIETRWFADNLIVVVLRMVTRIAYVLSHHQSI